MEEADREQDKKLREIFEEGHVIYEEILNTDQPTNSGDIQVKIRRAMKLFEDATKLASITSMFSSNESVEEVATQDLQFFLLPSLLGNLTQKLSVTDRIEVVETADIYFRDFLQRCKDYGITDVDIPQPNVSEEDNGDDTLAQSSRQLTPAQGLIASARNRASKIEQFKEQKALEAQLKAMKENVTANVDDEIKRKYYLTLIKCHINECLSELDSLQSEKEILKYMAKMRTGGSLSANEIQDKLSKGPKPKPLKAIILTKDEVQKKVFGAGYPSLPSMTVKEFYDQRVKDGIFPDAATVQARCLQDLASQQNAEAIADEEAAESERRVEEDDEETLMRAREMDEYKDNHRRGWGNRYNRS
ncbi:immunoglobulin-binding protein 1 [Homalodisca vitripennis]|uniref:immunoglobulin-binding protein 1 n=1 Tax=Homalodisca vitripennis TaxID=197043 RepID=UPI001EEA552B|nr:immunoglobulin-binding protein 1 [Homalodisca vitripennis]